MTAPQPQQPLHLVRDDDRQLHRKWLCDLTSIPTAAGREFRVARWIERWVNDRPGVLLEADASGNLILALEPHLDDPGAEADPTRPTLWITAHLDHPAFVVSRIISPTVLELEFRGSVMPDYFAGGADLDGDGPGAHLLLFPDDQPDDGPGTRLRLLDRGRPADKTGPLKRYLAELADARPGAADAESLGVRPGDVAIWDLPRAEIRRDAGGVGADQHDGELLFSRACDDLAAAAAALSAFDVLRTRARAGEPVPDVRLLFTRAEEIGFIGAIAACKHGTLTPGCRVIALENSRASSEAPHHGGPIVRVGDRISIFSPRLTSAVNKRAEQVAGGKPPTASQKLSEAPTWRWQRRLMSGGACEATVFTAAGLESTCVCLPLGNYHNMGDLDAVQAGTNTRPPTIEPEYISLRDYNGMIDLLVACGLELPEDGGLNERLEQLWDERKFVLES